MQLNIFQDESLSTGAKVRKEKIDAVLKLFSTTNTYFQFSDQQTTRNKQVFNNDFLFLCDDLLNSNELDQLKKVLRNDSFPINNFSDEFFDDPRKDYYQILVSYLKGENVSKKQLGAFYTPQDVVTTLVETVIKKAKLKTIELKTKKILDPTMGGGDWLTAWFEKVISTTRKNGVMPNQEKETIFENVIHGVDIDPIAVLCTRLIFWHYFDYKTSSKKNIKSNLVLGNAIDSLNDKRKDIKFDLILGNPPYVVQNLKGLNCHTRNSNNLYAVITEASAELLTPGGVLCFVVPLSLTCAKSMSSLRGYMDENFEEVIYSTYGIRPQKMFDGVDQRITVFIAKKRSSTQKATKYTSYRGHLQWRDRKDLVQSLKHEGEGCAVNGVDVVEDGWPKVKSPLEVKIINKIKSKKDETFFDLISKTKTNFPVYYYGNARYFIKALDYVPFYKNSKDPKKENSELKVVYLKDAVSQKATIALLNSTLFYWAWVLFSDCFHMDIKILKHFSIKDGELKKFSNVANQMISSLKDSSFKKKHGENLITEFNVRDCLNEIRAIDVVLCDFYSLSSSEASFAKNYASDLRKEKNSEDSDEHEEELAA